MTAVHFWYEFASTYSYLAAMRVEAAALAADREIVWRPFLLGPIFAAQGMNDSPFNIYPVKGAYMWRDMERLCADAGLPWRKPSGFPRNGVLASRVVLAMADQQRAAFSKAVYGANFADDLDISQPEVLLGILRALGLPAEELLEQAQSPEIRQSLRRQTEEAQALGLFGAPTFTVGKEVFWGQDRLAQALAWT